MSDNSVNEYFLKTVLIMVSVKDFTKYRVGILTDQKPIRL